VDTLKLTAAIILGMGAIIVAGLIGESRLPRSSECEANYQLSSNFEPTKWQPVGWKVQDGFPPIGCTMPKDKIVYEDGTWEWR
jgi:hypothetical protein